MLRGEIGTLVISFNKKKKCNSRPIVCVMGFRKKGLKKGGWSGKN
jgi:hypothetical protein